MMEQLSIYLPPFSSDYAGVCSALFDLNCMIIINDANCCTGNYVFYDEPRWGERKKATFCSELRTIDAILGDDDKVIRQSIEAAGHIRPDFIAMLGSPVPAIIGMDMDGIAREVEAGSRIPAIGFDTTGFSYYDRGVSEAMLAVTSRFTCDRVQTVPGSVNMLGVTPIDFSANENCAMMRQLLQAAGFEVLCSFLMQTGLDEVRKAGNAAVNLVVTQSGWAAARAMQERFGIPYVVGTPLGVQFSDVVIQAVRQTDIDQRSRILHYSGENTGRQGAMLVIGDQVMANSIRSTLRYAGCKREITVASFFDMAAELSLAGDVKLRSESHLVSLLRSGRYEKMIGDPLIGEIPAASAVELIELPHPAISSHLHRQQVPVFCGEAFDEFIHMVCM